MTNSIAIETSEELASDDDIVLSVQGVSKKFCRSLKKSLFYGLQDIAGELLGTRQAAHQLREQEFWALKDISFELRRGQAIGLVGVNGSGKTTLLRIISGLIKPDTGLIRHQGRLAPLIALQAGFSPVLTGRENVYANMSILGLSTREIDDRLKEVLDFADIGDAIDSPVYSYSSGMGARLGFACAIHTEPDILLIDEVLAVGDLKFRIKCSRQLHKLREKGTSFIFVSHSASLISSICDYAIYLKQGLVSSSGDVISVLNQYEEDLFINSSSQPFLGSLVRQKQESPPESGLAIRHVFFRDFHGNVVESPISGEPVVMTIICDVTESLNDVYCIVNAKSAASEDQEIIYVSSTDDGIRWNLSPGSCEITVHFPYFCLGVGIYDSAIAVRLQKGTLLDRVDVFKFAVKKAPHQSHASVAYQPRSWQFSMQTYEKMP